MPSYSLMTLPWTLITFNGICIIFGRSWSIIELWFRQLLTFSKLLQIRLKQYLMSQWLLYEVEIETIELLSPFHISKPTFKWIIQQICNRNFVKVSVKYSKILSATTTKISCQFPDKICNIAGIFNANETLPRQNFLGLEFNFWRHTCINVFRTLAMVLICLKVSRLSETWRKFKLWQ